MRIVDVEAALTQRGYPALDTSLELDISDATLPENAGRYVLTLESGKAKVTRGGSGRIQLDVRALAAVFSGFSHPSEMQAAGLLHGDPSDVARFGAVFSGPSPYLQDQF